MASLAVNVAVDIETIEKLPLRSNEDTIESAFKIDEHLARYYYLMEQEFTSLALSEE